MYKKDSVFGSNFSIGCSHLIVIFIIAGIIWDQVEMIAISVVATIYLVWIIYAIKRHKAGAPWR